NRRNNKALQMKEAKLTTEHQLTEIKIMKRPTELNIEKEKEKRIENDENRISANKELDKKDKSDVNKCQKDHEMERAKGF
ncbi:359_t:CDS:2, partial [Dentiscutata erythropus]